LAITTQTRSIVALAAASVWLTCTAPPCSSTASRVTRDVLTAAALAAPLGGWELLLAPTLACFMHNAFLWHASRDTAWSSRHVAAVLLCVPVGMSALALQDCLLSRAGGGGTAVRLHFRLQRTLQLLFNGAFSSAADVSSPCTRVAHVFLCACHTVAHDTPFMYTCHSRLTHTRVASDTQPQPPPPPHRQ